LSLFADRGRSSKAVFGTGIALAVLSAFSAGMIGMASPALDLTTYLAVVGMGALLVLIATMASRRLALSAWSPARLGT